MRWISKRDCLAALFCSFYFSSSLGTEGFYTFHNQDDCQDDHGRCEDQLEPVTPASAAKDSQLALNRDDQAGDGGAKHEGHGEEEHLVILADLTQPCGNSHQSDACQGHNHHGIEQEAGEIIAGLEIPLFA